MAMLGNLINHGSWGYRISGKPIAMIRAERPNKHISYEILSYVNIRKSIDVSYRINRINNKTSIGT
jgi:hypothetical protein